MKGKRYTTEEKIRILRQADGEKKITDLCREHNVSEVTFVSFPRNSLYPAVLSDRRTGDIVIDLSYIDPSGTNGGDAGDPYTGWDRFGRTQDMRWVKGATTLERVLYGYDRDSRRTRRENPVATSGEDEFYQYDGLSQVKDRTRGDLNVNHTAIGGVPLRKEAFGYDPIGNWKDYDVWQSGIRTLDQTRVPNTSNILTQIDGSSALLDHDAAGK